MQSQRERRELMRKNWSAWWKSVVDEFWDNENKKWKDAKGEQMTGTHAALADELASAPASASAAEPASAPAPASAAELASASAPASAEDDFKDKVSEACKSIFRECMRSRQMESPSPRGNDDPFAANPFATWESTMKHLTEQYGLKALKSYPGLYWQVQRQGFPHTLDDEEDDVRDVVTKVRRASTHAALAMKWFRGAAPGKRTQSTPLPPAGTAASIQSEEQCGGDACRSVHACGHATEFTNASACDENVADSSCASDSTATEAASVQCRDAQSGRASNVNDNVEARVPDLQVQVRLFDPNKDPSKGVGSLNDHVARRVAFMLRDELVEFMTKDDNSVWWSLHGVWLYQADLRKGSQNLRGINLCHAMLREAKLDKADLTKANLTGAVLQQASLQDVCLREATLNHANLEEARLTRANLVQCKLEKTVFLNTTLAHATIPTDVLNTTADFVPPKRLEPKSERLAGARDMARSGGYDSLKNALSQVVTQKEDAEDDSEEDDDDESSEDEEDERTNDTGHWTAVIGSLSDVAPHLLTSVDTLVSQVCFRTSLSFLDPSPLHLL